MSDIVVKCPYCDSTEPCWDGKSLAGIKCQHPRMVSITDRTFDVMVWSVSIAVSIGAVSVSVIVAGVAVGIVRWAFS